MDPVLEPVTQFSIPAQQLPAKEVLPAEMLEHEAWVLWRYVQRPNEKKPRKMPYYANGSIRSNGMELDSADDIKCMVTFDEAFRAALSNQHRWSGIGFAVRDGLSIGGIDLDDCLDDAGNFLNSVAERIFERAKQLGCYCEVSPSGGGVRIIGRTKGFKAITRPKFEAYSSKRFLTITGRCIANPNGFGDIDAAVQMLDHLTATDEDRKTNASTKDHGLGQNIPGPAYVKPEQISEGGRNSAVLSFVGHIRAQGMPEKFILEAALDFNRARCVPPLGSDEVVDIVDRYKRDADPLVSGDWPEPKEILPTLPPVKPFDPSMLPDEFRDYVMDQSELMQAPPDFIGSSLMVAAAAVLGNRWAIAPKKLDESWLVIPVIWGGVVARPGAKKSPALGKAFGFLHEVEENIRSAFVSRLEEYNGKKVVYDAEVAAAKKSAKSGQFNGVLREEPVRPEPERLIVNDTTVQKIGDILQWSPRGVLLQKDELVGHLESLRTEGQEISRSFYLEAWNGNAAYRIDRIGRGSLIIERLAVWIFGGIQPSKLLQYVGQAVSEGGNDDGLLQRFQMIVWPDQDDDFKIIDRPADKAAADRVQKAILRLRTLSARDVDAHFQEKGGVSFLHFSDDAQKFFKTLWERIEKSARSSTLHPALASHYAKYPRLVASLALVIHLIDYGTGPVSLDALKKAATWLNYLKSHAIRVYSSATTLARSSSYALAEKIRANQLEDNFTARDLERKSWSKLTNRAEIQTALECLVDADWLIPVEVPAGTKTKTVYKINPRVGGE